MSPSFEVGTYKKAHRHGPGAHVIILPGPGLLALWKEGERADARRLGPGTMFSPPEWCFHQHFNTGTEPARYLALRREGAPEHRSDRHAGRREERRSPNQIEFEYEDPAIYEEFAAELAGNGVEVRQPRPAYATGPRPDFKDL